MRFKFAGCLLTAVKGHTNQIVPLNKRRVLISWGQGQQRFPYQGPWWEQLMLRWNFHFLFFFFAPPLVMQQVLQVTFQRQAGRNRKGAGLLTPGVFQQAASATDPTGITDPTPETSSPRPRRRSQKHGKLFKSQTQRPKGTLAVTIPTNFHWCLMAADCFPLEQPCRSGTLCPGGGKHSFMARRALTLWGSPIQLCKSFSKQPATLLSP